MLRSLLSLGLLCAAANALAGEPLPSWNPNLEQLWDEEEGMAAPTVELPPQRTRDEPPIASARPLPPKFDLVARARPDASGRLLVKVDDEQRVLTLDAQLQGSLDGILRNYAPPYAAVVAIEPGTGRVLAMSEFSEAQPKLRGLTTAAIFPAASIFKIVTGAALLDAGIAPDTRECFHGGKRRLSARHLVDSSRDRSCTTLSSAMGMSANVVFAKLTKKHLDAADLRGWAEAFGFNRQIPFPIPTEISSALVPEDEFGLAETGAGFGDVYMSPLHGANVAATTANNGVWRDPVLFEDEVSPTTPGTRVMTAEQAQAMEQMLEETVTRGTARRIFRERGYRVAGAVGKTGSLADKRPFRDYTWFVGYAPKDNPRIAVAALIVNDYVWRIRAPWLARETMRLYLSKPARAPVVSTNTDTN